MYPEVLQRRVEPLAVLAKALLAILDVSVDLDNLGLKHVPVRLQAGEHVDQVRLSVCTTRIARVMRRNAKQVAMGATNGFRFSTPSIPPRACAHDVVGRREMLS